jgi:release factor glutamine methyltransferase
VALLSNPPYIAPTEAPELAPEVHAYEPHGALFAPMEGLAFYHAILRQARGWVAVEIGHTQHHAVATLATHYAWENLTVHRDLAGVVRVISMQKP